MGRPAAEYGIGRGRGRPTGDGRVRRAASYGASRGLAVRRVPRRRRRDGAAFTETAGSAPVTGCGWAGVRRADLRRTRQGRPQGRRRERRGAGDRAGAAAVPSASARRPSSGARTRCAARCRSRSSPWPNTPCGPVRRWPSTAPHCSPDRDAPARSGSSRTCHDRRSTRSPRRGCAPCSWRSPPVPRTERPDRSPACASSSWPASGRGRSASCCSPTWARRWSASTASARRAPTTR